MKKLLVVLLSVAISVLFAGYVMAFTGSYIPGAGINGTPHDIPRVDTGMGYLPVTTPADTLQRVCIYCHAPHHAYRLSTAGASGTGPIAPSDYTYLPLWNHLVTTQAFLPYYNGPDAPATGMKAAQSITSYVAIGSSSLLCLSCHDGTIGVNAYGHAPQDLASRSTGTAVIATQYRIGQDGYLANHHPIGFVYSDVATADPEIFPALTGTFDLTAGAQPIANFLYGGKMECASCHAVHNKGNDGEKLLYVSDFRSNLCLSCHDKGAKSPIP